MCLVCVKYFNTGQTNKISPHSKAVSNTSELFVNPGGQCRIKIEYTINLVNCSWMIFVNLMRPSDTCMRQQTNHHWFRQLLVAWPAQSHYLNQCRDIDYWNPRKKKIGEISSEIQTFSSTKLHLKMSYALVVAVMSRPQCVDGLNKVALTIW